MAGNNRGRPKSDDPKIKFDNVRLKTTTMFDIKMIAEELGINESVLVQTILENEMPKYKKLLGIEE
ncbi:hypothetical protein CPG37_04535 [Malaciobacter canalis]|uniref:Chromosome partitioning protein ParB n=1 Tax=Malaciobacter canalis TaxID=1912871 RepID=A0ABX4LUY7_9BACT|nr:MULTISPECIES: hypothetical protein [Malaciobacter]PHO10319.1 hypothetical protein CPG37_04535 [Malaciobacter canalis]QEE32424.1 hypothetical protein ACAN_0935 [Malaciobacter canalis]RYA23907.1 hypothetical protein CRU96_05730 [Malaciobacter halophilus]